MSRRTPLTLTAPRRTREQRLEWCELYNAYAAIFDVQLESFVEERGTTVPEFLAAAQGEEGLASLYISLILASTEYDAFVGMMAEACEQIRRRLHEIRLRFHTIAHECSYVPSAAAP